MQHQVLDIRAGAAGTTAKLYTYIRDESPEMEAHRRPAVVICPGGRVWHDFRPGGGSRWR